MPIIKSAKKRVRVARKAAVRNRKTRRNLKSALKTFTKSVGSEKKQLAKAQSKAQSELDKAVKKGVIHKNKAARIKHNLSLKAKTESISKKLTTSKKTAVKKIQTKK